MIKIKLMQPYCEEKSEVKIKYSNILSPTHKILSQIFKNIYLKATYLVLVQSPDQTLIMAYKIL